MRKSKGAKLRKQITFRVSETMYSRIDAIAFKMDIDPSDVIRIIIGEHIEEHEKRAKIQPPPDTAPDAHKP